MLKEKVEKIKKEDVSKIIDYIDVIASMRKNHRDIMDNVTSFNVQPYTQTNDDLVTVYIFYKKDITPSSYHSNSLPCTFSVTDYFYCLLERI